VLAAVDLGDLEVERRVVEDSVSGTLLDVEREVTASLLVVGSRGMPSVAGAILGSVSRQITHHAVGPVLVIRP
jgi:nucleotide-binding universal stress UspA family protein